MFACERREDQGSPADLALFAQTVTPRARHERLCIALNLVPRRARNGAQIAGSRCARCADLARLCRRQPRDYERAFSHGTACQVVV